MDQIADHDKPLHHTDDAPCSTIAEFFWQNSTTVPVGWWQYISSMLSAGKKRPTWVLCLKNINNRWKKMVTIWSCSMSGTDTVPCTCYNEKVVGLAADPVPIPYLFCVHYKPIAAAHALRPIKTENISTVIMWREARIADNTQIMQSYGRVFKDDGGIHLVNMDIMDTDDDIGSSKDLAASSRVTYARYFSDSRNMI